MTEGRPIIASVSGGFDYREYVEDNLDRASKSAGDNVSATCPFCGKAKHFSVNVETGRWRCFKCDERSPDFARLIAEVEGISVARAYALMMRQAITFRKPREEAPEGLLVRLQRLRGTAGEPQTPEGMLTPLPAEFVPVYGPGGWSMPEYLLQRGVTRKAARHWGLGYCTRGRYADRIVMPFACANGQSFTARAAVDGMRGPRYLNPDEAKHGRLVYGWECANVHPAIALVEGPFDVIKLWQHGLPALGLLGKALHREQLRLLCRLPAVTRIVLMLDPEARCEAFEIAARLSARFDNLWIAQLPPGVDPGKASKAQARAALDGAERYTGDRATALKVAIGAV